MTWKWVRLLFCVCFSCHSFTFHFVFLTIFLLAPLCSVPSLRLVCLTWTGLRPQWNLSVCTCPDHLVWSFLILTNSRSCYSRNAMYFCVFPIWIYIYPFLEQCFDIFSGFLLMFGVFCLVAWVQYPILLSFICLTCVLYDIFLRDHMVPILRLLIFFSWVFFLSDVCNVISVVIHTNHVFSLYIAFLFLVQNNWGAKSKGWRASGRLKRRHTEISCPRSRLKRRLMRR